MNFKGKLPAAEVDEEHVSTKPPRWETTDPLGAGESVKALVFQPTSSLSLAIVHGLFLSVVVREPIPSLKHFKQELCRK